ncbi:translation initiation factor eIF-2B subunit beta-like [Pomacea canaliculata]|uniref:translation initiation factor eIF-2B subunit beta-like n=1 Tax=Pomacea canaliculata TaxID=400727 RepID=UPI000D733BFB|nr:translation initiation factor eIF-2B subunit beta-like [Pomacea canaliculata]
MPADTDKKELQERMESFMADLRKNVEGLGSYTVASRTVDLLRRIISKSKWASAKELMEIIRAEGKKLMAADPSESVVGNMVRRVLKIIREEYASGAKGVDSTDETDAQESLHNLLLAEGGVEDFSKSIPTLKASINESIGELLTELEGSAENVATQALEHIYGGDTIMTIGKSRTVLAFLKNAARKRSFNVIVAEGFPFLGGHDMALKLSEANIPTKVIPDADVFAFMPHVNKVIIGTHTVMADGGLKSITGTRNIAKAAKHFSKQVLVCAAMYKLSPQYFHSLDQEGFNKFANPQMLLPFEEMEGRESVEIINPVFNYVPPDCVTLYITNMGSNAPSYVYRLLSELYHPDDREL